MAACAVAVLALSRVLSTGQLAFAAIASLFTAAAVIEHGAAWGLGVWAASSALALLLTPGGAAGWLFTLFFGYYPVIKLAAEKSERRFVAWGIKAAGFIIGEAVIFAGARLLGFELLNIPLLTEASGWGILIAAAAGLVIFIVYDVGYSKLLAFYKARLSRSSRGRRT
jgi:hypothetical protein